MNISMSGLMVVGLMMVACGGDADAVAGPTGEASTPATSDGSGSTSGGNATQGSGGGDLANSSGSGGGQGGDDSSGATGGGNTNTTSDYPPSDCQPVKLCGDCNNDGKVSVLDALLAAQHDEGINKLEGVHFASCDVDNNGVVDDADSQLIAEFAVDLPVKLTCCL